MQPCAANNKYSVGKDDSTQGSNKEKEDFACKLEIVGTEPADIADKSVVELHEKAGHEELGNDDFDESVDNEGDNVTLGPICFEDISWTPPILKCHFCDKMEELFKARKANEQLESANKKLSPKVLNRESLCSSGAKMQYFIGLQSYDIGTCV